MTNGLILRIGDIDELDRIELEQELGPRGVSFEEAAAPSATHPELVTIIAVVLVTVKALVGLAIWLGKKRRKGEVEQNIETVRPDGTKETKRLHVKFSSSDAPSAEVLKQIGAQLDLDPEMISKALAILKES